MEGPECVVCLQLYDEGEHTPRVLSCGHSVCESCVLDLWLHWGGNSGIGSASAVQKGGGLVQCPECKQHTKVPLGGVLGIPKNIELMRFIQRKVVPRSSEVDSNGNVVQDPVQEVELDSKKIKERVVKKEQIAPSSEQEAEDFSKPYPLLKQVHGEPVLWVLPQAAVKRRKDLVHGFCIGDMRFQKKPQLEGQEVCLQILSSIHSYDSDRRKGSKYNELVQLAWERFHHDVQARFLQFVGVSCHSKYFAEVAGLWMSEEGNLFLVSKVHVEGIKRARNLFSSKSDDSSRLDLRSAEGEGSLCGPLKEEENLNENSLRTLINLGVELCELLMEIHSAGLVVAILGPDSFSLDKFGHLQLLVGACVFLRPHRLDLVSNSSWNSCSSSMAVSTPIIQETDIINSSSLETLHTNHECFSPEVLRLLERSLETDEAGEIPPAGFSFEGGGEAGHISVTQKADVWSLGCVLLQLFSGSSSLGGLPSSRVYHGGVSKISAQQEAGLAALGQYVCLQEQVLKCFALVPSDRPRLVNIWWELKVLLDVQALDISIHVSDQFEDELDVEICDFASIITSANIIKSDRENAGEARAFVLPDATASTSTPVLPRPLIDVEQCSAQLTTLPGHLDTVSCLAVCGDHLISASFDKTLRVWSLKDGKLVKVFEGHEQRITALAVYEASGLVISGDYGGHINAWNIESRGVSGPLATWLEHQDWRYSGVASLAVSSDELLYSGSGDKTIKAWSIMSFEHVTTMDGHKGVVSVLLVDGQFLYSGSWDGTIRLWWRPDHSPLANFVGVSSVPLGGIRAVVKSPTAGLLFAGHDSGVVQVWKEDTCVGTLKAHAGVVSSLAFDQCWLYSGSWDGFVKAWSLEEVLNGGYIPVEKQCSERAVTALCCRQAKLFVGLRPEIQVYCHQVLNECQPLG